MNNEFEESENATKELSLRLMEAKDPHEILNLFEQKYIHENSGREIYGEELVMILKFLHATLT